MPADYSSKMGSRNLPTKEWLLGTEESTEAASFPVFDPASATTFDHENCNFVSFNSELDSAVSQYLSQVSELGYRPTSSGSNLSTFKADWKDGNNSVASVNSRTSERLLAVQFQLHSPESCKTEDNQAQVCETVGSVEYRSEIPRDSTPETSEKQPSSDNFLVNNAVYSSSSDSSSAQENYYENGDVSVTDEPIYENLDGSSDEVFNKEPLYDTVPRRPQVPPKPESLARTLSQENNLNSSTKDYPQNDSSVSEDSQCADDASGDSLSAESLSDSLSQDIERSSKRRKKKIKENTDESLIVDGSETSDLGSSGSEDVASIDEWLSSTPPPKANTTLSVSFEVKGTTSSKPETALELLEGEVLAEVQRERSLSVADTIPREGNTLVIGGTSDDEDSSIQAINSSIVEVCRSHDEIDEARIIDDVSSSSSEDLNAVPAIRHSVIIELKGSDKENKCHKHVLKRSGSLHAPSSESERNLRKNKSSKKKNRRMSETGLGVCVGVIHDSKTNAKEFFEIGETPVSNHIIEISEDGSWGLKSNEGGNSKLDDSKTASSKQIIPEKEDKSGEKNRANIKSRESKNTDIRTSESSKKVLKLPSGKKKRATGTSVLKKQKGNMEGADIIAAPPEAFSCVDGLDGVFSASCVALTSEPNSLASSLANEPSVPEAPEKTDAEAAKSADTPIIIEEIPKAALENEPKKHWKSNLGSAIMESYDKEMNKKKESLNLPEVSMLDFGQSAFDLELDRKNVIKQMIVKTKKKESWFGRAFGTDADAAAPKVTAANSVKRSNSMSCVAGPNNKGLLSSKGKEPPKDLHFMNMKNAAAKAQPTCDEDDFVFPSFMSDAEITSDKNVPVKTSSPIEPIPSIELTIKKLGIDELNPPSPPYKLNKHLTTITPFKPPSQNRHSSIKNIKNPLLSDPVAGDLSAATDNTIPSDSIAVVNPTSEIVVDEATPKLQVNVTLDTSVDTTQENLEDMLVDTCFESTETVANHVADDALKQPTIMADVVEPPKAKGEVDAASILEQKQTTKRYWEDKMAATAAPPNEDLGWEPVANVCFRDPNAPIDTDSSEHAAPEASAGTDYLPAPPPQFDNTPPVSIEPAKENNHKLEQERIISLDDEISVLEREVLGEVVASDIEEDIEEISEKRQFVEETVKTNHKYVYGEEGAQEVVPKVQTVLQNRRGDPDRLPTVKSTYSATQCKENVIEAEIRAQQERERELQLEQMKKKEFLQQNLRNGNTSELIRHKGASSPHDSDEGFVDPPVERAKLEATTKQTVSVVCSDGGYAHVVTDHDGESVIYDAVAPPKITSPRPMPEAPTSSPSPVLPKTAPKSPPAAPVPHTTETKIALEIRELKEREEELRRMREARQGVKKIQNGASEEENHEDFAEVDIEDGEDRGSSSSREILDDHLTSLTTTTDEGNFSECGDATSSEDKSSNGSNSRIMSPEVPSAEYPRPSRRVTVRPFQADDDDDRPVYTRMKNESVIEREIRIAKERDEAYKKEKGLLNGGPPQTKTASVASANGTAKHAALQHSVSLSAVPNGTNKGAQHQLATSRIQLEIAENGQRERELMSAGKVLTLSEDTVDDKVTRLSDLADLPTAQELGAKSPTSSTSLSSSTRQSPAVSPHSTLSNSSRSSNNGLSNGFSNGHHFNGATMPRLTKSLSTTNLSSPQSSLSSTGTTMRPKGLMEKFIASRGKMTPSAFTSAPPMGAGSGRVVATRPMRVQPKKPVLLRQHSNDSTDGGSSMALELRTDVRSGPSPPPPHLYKRVIGAEEKIQEELREMQQREEELKRLRSKSLAARSQPNLLEMSLNEIPFEDDQGSTAAEDEPDTAAETGDGTDAIMRSAVSNPNLVDDVSENVSVKKLNRRRSALIAQWENRIQSTAAVDA